MDTLANRPPIHIPPHEMASGRIVWKLSKHGTVYTPQDIGRELDAAERRICPRTKSATVTWNTHAPRREVVA